LVEFQGCGVDYACWRVIAHARLRKELFTSALLYPLFLPAPAGLKLILLSAIGTVWYYAGWTPTLVLIGVLVGYSALVLVLNHAKVRRAVMELAKLVNADFVQRLQVPVDSRGCPTVSILELLRIEEKAFNEDPEYDQKHRPFFEKGW
jgi:hypothetical protein